MILGKRAQKNLDRLLLRIKEKENGPRYYDEKINHGGYFSYYKECDNNCGGSMSWCSCCEMWSNNCCVPYGTCQCS